MDISQLKTVYIQERNRLNDLCDKWQTILEDGRKKIYSEDVKGTILSVVGQTRLLLDKKLKQFEQLLNDGEQQRIGISGETELDDMPPITLSDLEGYWEVVMLQVREAYTRFSELENLDIHKKCTQPTKTTKINTPINKSRVIK